MSLFFRIRIFKVPLINGREKSYLKYNESFEEIDVYSQRNRHEAFFVENLVRSI